MYAAIFWSTFAYCYLPLGSFYFASVSCCASIVLCAWSFAWGRVFAPSGGGLLARRPRLVSRDHVILSELLQPHEPWDSKAAICTRRACSLPNCKSHGGGCWRLQGGPLPRDPPRLKVWILLPYIAVPVNARWGSPFGVNAAFSLVMPDWIGTSARCPSKSFVGGWRTHGPQLFVCALLRL